MIDTSIPAILQSVKAKLFEAGNTDRYLCIKSTPSLLATLRVIPGKTKRFRRDAVLKPASIVLTCTFQVSTITSSIAS